MEQIEIIKKAIQSRKPISFEYNKQGKTTGKRIGNPHTIYIHSGTGNVLVDLYQTDGVSDSANSGEKELPSWNRFDIEYMNNIIILENYSDFDIAPGYNPYSDRYYNSIFLAT